MKNFLTSSRLNSDDVNTAKNAVADECAPVRINVERMKEALSQDSISIPMGLSISQKIAFMMNQVGSL